MRHARPVINRINDVPSPKPIESIAVGRTQTEFRIVRRDYGIHDLCLADRESSCFEATFDVSENVGFNRSHTHEQLNAVLQRLAHDTYQRSPLTASPLQALVGPWCITNEFFRATKTMPSRRRIW